MKKSTKDINHLKKPEIGTSFRPGTIGDLSVRVGYDVRDLMMEGYELDEIYDVASGRCTLKELRQRGPRRKRKR